MAVKTTLVVSVGGYEWEKVVKWADIPSRVMVVGIEANVSGTVRNSDGDQEILCHLTFPGGGAGVTVESMERTGWHSWGRVAELRERALKLLPDGWEEENILPFEQVLESYGFRMEWKHRNFVWHIWAKAQGAEELGSGSSFESALAAIMDKAINSVRHA